MKEKSKSGTGFTIIELLVVMAIIVIVSGLVLANWRGGEKQYALQRAANKLAQDIRRVEEFAMSARAFQGQIPKGGYGIYFKISEKDHYILFADLNGNNHYDSGSDGLVEDIKIEKEVQISQLSASPLHITFTPPDPTVTIKPDALLAQITLAIQTDPTKTKTIQVNKAGLVYIGLPSPPSPPTPTPTYTLTVSRAGTGSGTVTSSPGGINCGSDCTEAYNSGTSVTLTATAASGSTFAGWSGGGCSGTGNCSVTMDANKTVTATFNITVVQYTLTVQKSGTGSGTVTSSPAGINCGSDCTEAYNSGTSVTLTATAASGSTFAGWSGGGCSGTGNCTVTMDANKTVTATFNAITYTLTVTVGTGGYVSSTDGKINNCRSTCTANYSSGASVTLNAYPDSSYLFTGWTGACTGTGSCNLTMNSNKSVGASFSYFGGVCYKRFFIYGLLSTPSDN